MTDITFKKILSDTKSFIQTLSSRAQEIENERRLPNDIIEELRSIGIFRMNMPKNWGGLEFNSMQQTQVIEQIAIADTAVAWCAMIGSDSGIYSGYLQESTSKKLFTLDTITAGWIHPQGIASEVDGGYLVNGNWRFGSGLSHCDLLVAGCYIYKNGEKVLDEDGSPIWRVMIARPNEYQLGDGWFTTGLVGSGSRDYSAKDLFVPKEHSFSFYEPHRTGPLHDTPDAILRNMSGIPLGIARAAINYVRSLADLKFDRTTQDLWSKSPRIQIAVAKCEMELFSARCAVYSSLTEQWQTLEQARKLNVEQRALPALARQNAFQTARRIVSTIYDLVGGASIYKNETPMDRWLRDVNTICQHAVAQENILQTSGQLLLDKKTNHPFI
ncbi:acyl-CoA dehydrogenase family protein [Photorhabdus tasmaniensis]|uniref:acyl-CoA dehydrogenase family protein n=1 Tax=Photorhabdus tasmaniensis TaxID=1004159 RepID=UPI0040432991